ncbi:hypothetical protein ACV3K4_04325 [Clostridium perfringens]|uniref:hypothetical protein n=1 Tax=Clostridium perfringens TaxID=1502 RepID=UPI002A1014DB|nr:hypothetical protein [Clostridium perfringens]MDK0728085.1 hypothetical protein [Clostridium perfringens]MDM0771294.1 hypothetical protein [Clostridium perfringens]MDM0843225.1 hypothetical protein [Clostridium perfringens]
MRCSSKYLNILSSIEIVNTPELSVNGLLLVTSGGIFIGKPMPNKTDYTPIADSVLKIKEAIIEKLDGITVNDLIGDGSIITLLDAKLLSIDNQKILLNTNDISIHASEVIAFTPINIEDYLSQIS